MAVDIQTQAERKKKMTLIFESFLCSIPVLGVLICGMLLLRHIFEIIAKSSSRLEDLGILLIGTLAHAGLVFYFWSAVVDRNSGYVILVIIVGLIFIVNYKMFGTLMSRGVLGDE